MRILFFGSRDWSDELEVENMILRMITDHGLQWTLVNGGAKGADSIARRLGNEFGLRVDTFRITPADWKTYGRGAGPRRNQQMLDSGINFAVGFRTKGKSNGTDDMARRLRGAKVPHLMIEEEN